MAVPRRFAITGSQAGSIRVDNGVVIREDTSATGNIAYGSVRLISRISWNKGNNQVTVGGPAISGFANMPMSASDAEAFTTGLRNLAGYAAGSPHSTLE